jgi:di/tripeptidase
MEKSERNYKLAEFINQVYAKEGLPILKPYKRLGGSDAAYTSKYLPTVDNLGTEGGDIHSEREYMEKASLVRSAKRIASVLFHI